MYRNLLVCTLVFFLSACGDIGTPVNSSSNNTSSNSSTSNSAGGDAGMNEPDGAEPCQPVPEVCDGLDNDCDGTADEDFALGASCEVGQGACMATGTTVCAPNGNETQCDVAPEDAVVELCGDMTDNDCDGEVDEGFENLGDECVEGLGVCQNIGVIACSEDLTEASCSVEAGIQPEPTEVSCDGLDNDCDGEVDEGCDVDADGWCGMGFTAIPGGPCTDGEGDCDDQNDEIFPGSTIPGCDGADNDCDGSSDELQILPGSQKSAALSVNISATDYVNAPGLLVAPMSGSTYCGAGVYSSNQTLQFFFIDVAGAAVVTPTGTVTANDIRLIDIVEETNACTVLFGYIGAGGDPTLAIARTTIGSTSVSRVDVSNDTMVLTAPWAGGMYERFAGSFNIFGLTTTPSATGRIYRRTLSTSNSSYDGGSVLLQHIALAPDTSGAGYDDLIISNTFGVSRFWASDIQDFTSMTAWQTSFPLLFPDIEQVGQRTFQAGYDGATYHVRELLGAGPTIGAAGTIGTTSSRDYMTRHQLFEGPSGAPFVIDAAADQLYELTVSGATIAFAAADLSALPSGAELIAGKQTGPDSLEILYLERNGAPVDFSTSAVTCF